MSVSQKQTIARRLHNQTSSQENRPESTFSNTVKRKETKQIRPRIAANYSIKSKQSSNHKPNLATLETLHNQWPDVLKLSPHFLPYCTRCVPSVAIAISGTPCTVHGVPCNVPLSADPSNPERAGKRVPRVRGESQGSAL